MEEAPCRLSVRAWSGLAHSTRNESINGLSEATPFFPIQGRRLTWERVGSGGGDSGRGAIFPGSWAMLPSGGVRLVFMVAHTGSGGRQLSTAPRRAG